MNSHVTVWTPCICICIKIFHNPTFYLNLRNFFREKISNEIEIFDKLFLNKHLFCNFIFYLILWSSFFESFANSFSKRNLDQLVIYLQKFEDNLKLYSFSEVNSTLYWIRRPKQRPFEDKSIVHPTIGLVP